MSEFHSFRRTLLRFTAVTGMAVAAMVPMAQAAAQFSTIPRPNEVLTPDTVILVSYRTSLREADDSFELNLGAWSAPFPTRDGRQFRVHILPGPTPSDARLGPVFTLVVADKDGKELDRMNLGNSATGTFADLAIQFYIARL